MRFSDRMGGVRRSYIREILKVTSRPEVISFAGGLPNPDFFPVAELAQAAAGVFESSGQEALQYSTTEGFLPLREYIAARYKDRHGILADPDEILITTGSQQGLDLVGKVFVNPGEGVVIERPGYIGAIQGFSMFGAKFHAVDLSETGIDTGALDRTLEQTGAKLFYAVPNFQNPSGVSYDDKTRKETAEILSRHACLLIEDNPYGELRFMGQGLPLVRAYMDSPSILLGSCSKIVSPGLRLGWVLAPREVILKMVTAKQASDLHSSTLAQHILHNYLTRFDVDAHIQKIRAAYKLQRDLMVQAIQENFPKTVRFTEPEGGMFLWVTLPEGFSAVRLFDQAIEKNVAFVPGKPFYVDGTDNTFRLNFSNSSPERIREGMARLGRCLTELMD